MAHSEGGQKRPNIVFCFADDWGRYASAYAPHHGPGNLNELIQTPNFVRPSHTYADDCGLGAILEGARWDESIPSFPLELEKGGYHIGHTYKVWSPGRTINAPIGGERTQFQPAGQSYSFFSHFVTANAPELGVEPAKDILYEETRQNFQAFLASVPSDKPFCYWWGPTNTHRTWEKGSGKELWGIEPDTLKGRLPAFMPDVHEVREDAGDYLGECLAVDKGIGVLLEELEARGELENTLVIASGDHGIPGMPRAKCNLYDIGCEVALAARWPGNIAPGTVIHDFVNIMDLAPTFCEVGGVPPPSSMTATSILPLLRAERSGQIEQQRDFVVTGRERHVAIAREGFLPYPQRCIRTKDFIFIINFEPDRWPMGDPRGLDDLSFEPKTGYKQYEDETRAAFPDMDASPTKAFMIEHREDLDVEPLYQLGFGKRPREELYDLAKDPAYMNNVAQDPEYSTVRAELEARLLGVLTKQNDPRLMEQPCRYEFEPYAAPSLMQGAVPVDGGITYEEAVAKMDAMLQEAKTPRSYKLKPGQSRL